jgi:hypothetical protein
MKRIHVQVFKRYARVEAPLAGDYLSVIIEKKELIMELVAVMEQVSLEKKPVEFTFCAQESNEQLQASVIDLVGQYTDYIVLEKESNRFIFICEVKNNLSRSSSCFMVWNSRGIVCALVNEYRHVTIKEFTWPLQPKTTFERLSTNEIHASIIRFYGRPIEIQDLLKFKQSGDPYANRCLKEILESLLEITKEIQSLHQVDMFYASDSFPLFKDKSYVEKRNRLVEQKLTVTIA